MTSTGVYHAFLRNRFEAISHTSLSYVLATDKKANECIDRVSMEVLPTILSSTLSEGDADEHTDSNTEEMGVARSIHYSNETSINKQTQETKTINKTLPSSIVESNTTITTMTPPAIDNRLSGMFIQDFESLKKKVILELGESLFRNTLLSNRSTNATQEKFVWCFETIDTNTRYNIEFAPNIRSVEKSLVHGVIGCVDGHYDSDSEIFTIYNLYCPDLTKACSFTIEPSLQNQVWTKLFVLLPESQYHSLDIIDTRNDKTHSIEKYCSSACVSFPVSYTNPLQLLNNRVMIMYGSYLQQRCIEMNPSLHSILNVMECTMNLWRHVCPIIPSFGLVPREYDFEAKKRISQDHDELLVSPKCRLFIIADINPISSSSGKRNAGKTRMRRITNETQTVIHTNKSLCIELNVYLQVINISE